ncbi:MAG: hypothetical protein WCV86_05155 [Patescibacteria group bacterium]|jgi:hypothetical protein
MGSFIEINDTLQITQEQGFPAALILEKHLQTPFTTEDFSGMTFPFEKKDMRLYQPAPVRVHLVQNIDGKWLFWGEAHILEQTIHAEKKTTSGIFCITKIYPPDVQEVITKAQAPEDKSYF